LKTSYQFGLIAARLSLLCMLKLAKKIITNLIIFSLYLQQIQSFMEWRLFYPKLLLRDSNAVMEDLMQFYFVAEQVFLQLIPSNELETRTDQYLVSHHQFGIKYRNEEKLEIKIKRPSCMKYGIEPWVKHKLGKKALSLQIDTISELLTQSGYNTEIESFQKALRAEKYINATKHRKSKSFGMVSMEYCQLTLEDDSEWFSIAIESTDESVIEEAFTQPMIKEFFKSLHATMASLKSRDFHEFRPLVCGYPFWIKYVSGHRDFQNEEVAMVKDSLEDIFHLLQLQ
jgi:hypothetical protein